MVSTVAKVLIVFEELALNTCLFLVNILGFKELLPYVSLSSL